MALSDTNELLDRWFQGDRDALGELVTRNVDFVRRVVSKRLGQRLRAVGSTTDFVQEVLLDFLSYSPRFRVASRKQLRALLARVVENAIREQDSFWFQARKRDIARNVPLGADSVVDLRADGTPPDGRAQRAENDALLRLGIELLRPADRQLCVWRFWEELTLAEIAERLECNPEAARKRVQRAIARLGTLVEGLARGQVPGAETEK